MVPGLLEIDKILRTQGGERNFQPLFLIDKYHKTVFEHCEDLPEHRKAFITRFASQPGANTPWMSQVLGLPPVK